MVADTEKFLDYDGLAVLVGLVKDSVGDAEVQVDGTTISKSGSTISVKPEGVGSTQLADGSVTTAKLGGSLVVPIAKGGTGATSASQALTSLGAAAKSHTHAASDVTGTLQVEHGGTGATTASQARTNLGAAASSHTHAAGDIASGAVPVEHGGTGATTIDGARTVLFNFPDNDELLAYLGLS